MKIVFIIGGARSGKSSFAMKEAEKTAGRKAYIATAQAFDNEMKERIKKHKMERGADWDTFEEPEKIVDALLNLAGRYQIILLDCLTLWLSNLLPGTQSTEHRTQTEDKVKNKEQRQELVEGSVQELVDSLKHLQKVCAPGSEFCVLFVVSNEVGMGIVPENELARRFRDLAGMLNQKVAEIADEVYLVTAGIPVKIKG